MGPNDIFRKEYNKLIDLTEFITHNDILYFCGGFK